VRERTDVLRQRLGETAHFDDRAETLLEGGEIEPAEVGSEAQVVDDRHVRVEGRALGQVANAAPHGERVLENVVAVHGGRPGRWRKEARQNLRGGRLPCAIRSEETDDFALSYFEAHLV